MFYRQCVLRKNNVIQTSWIPEQYAKRGKYLKLRKNSLSGCLYEEGTWDDGWLVESVGSRQEGKYVLEHSQDYKHQRKASDI